MLQNLGLQLCRLILVVCCGFAASGYGEIYTWVDAAGKVHFGDKKIDNVAQREVQLDVQASAWRRYDIKIEAADNCLSKDEMQRIDRDVNNVYRFYAQVMHIDMYKTVPVNIKMFPDRAAYTRYVSSKGSDMGHQTFGIYFGKDNQIAAYIRKDDREGSFSTVKHEVSHAVLDTFSPYVPSWMNEGLAEQMETLTARSGTLTVARHRQNHSQVLRKKKAHSLLKLETLLKMPSKDWRSQSFGGQSLYSQSAELVYFLLNSSPDRSFLVRLLHKFHHGNRTLSFYLVDENYIGGIRSMQSKWDLWLNQGGVPFIRFVD